MRPCDVKGLGTHACACPPPGSCRRTVSDDLKHMFFFFFRPHTPLPPPPPPIRPSTPTPRSTTTTTPTPTTPALCGINRVGKRKSRDGRRTNRWPWMVARGLASLAGELRRATRCRAFCLPSPSQTPSSSQLVHYLPDGMVRSLSVTSPAGNGEAERGTLARAGSRRLSASQYGYAAAGPRQEPSRPSLVAIDRIFFFFLVFVFGFGHISAAQRVRCRSVVWHAVQDLLIPTSLPLPCLAFGIAALVMLYLLLFLLYHLFSPFISATVGIIPFFFFFIPPILAY